MGSNGLLPFSSQIRLDFRSGAPIYIQIMDRIKQQVVSGSLKPGDQLPTVRALATELRVNFNTVARAYRLLDEVGIISTQHGRGTFILEVPPPATAEKLRKHSLEALARRYLGEALRLGCEADEVIQTLQNQVAHWKETGDLSDTE